MADGALNLAFTARAVAGLADAFRGMQAAVADAAVAFKSFAEKNRRLREQVAAAYRSEYGRLPGSDKTRRLRKKRETVLWRYGCRRRRAPEDLRHLRGGRQRGRVTMMRWIFLAPAALAILLLTACAPEPVTIKAHDISTAELALKLRDANPRIFFYPDSPDQRISLDLKGVPSDELGERLRHYGRVEVDRNSARWFLFFVFGFFVSGISIGTVLPRDCDR